MSRVEARAWDGLRHGGSPFLRHGFLRAQEESGSVGGESGWFPVYLLAEDGTGALLGAAASFIKTHSYGEYIFDWSWAQAAEAAGLSYYPKLVVHPPATPATGPRVLLAPGVDEDAVTAALVAAVHKVADDADCSSIHWLFVTEKEDARLADFGYLSRSSYQFHWHNRGYETYDDFLAELTSRRRKQLRKERQKARSGLEVQWIEGPDLEDEHVVAMDRFYRQTVRDHWGGRAYMRPGFFEGLVANCSDQVAWVCAHRANKLIAGALFLESDQALYGRYWGANQQVEFLHFELAYYCGIERAIERAIPLFEAGAQGEHKLLRGFAPARTYSRHWFRHRGLSRAIGNFLSQEALEVEDRMRRLASALPFKRHGPDECEPALE